ncbi:hypothetical protein [Salinispora mooreana]|uniref:hypothetical protein n=1 Tax=Salinispora mooreana TaxID=999545 RepID=UPI00037041F7|nr:hypothetical protein [Salinispora mooreana]
MRTAYQRLGLGVLGGGLLVTLLGCSADEPAESADQAPAVESATKARERVQAYLDAVAAKDVAAGRSQFCAVMHPAFDAVATGPSGDFADHFEVSQAQITEVEPGPRGEEVSAALSVTTDAEELVRPLLFTVTRDGADWCIASETPGSTAPAPTTTPEPTETQ